jgi:hyperosmotically inducible periplasmic protein
MKKMLFSFLIGAGVGWGGYWYVDRHPAQIWQARQKVIHTAEATAGSLKEKVSELTGDIIKKELSNSGVYVAEKAKQAGAAIADAASDARITGTIKAKLLAEPGLSVLKIGVDTSAGLVTLSGTVNSYDAIAKAVSIAMATAGVHKVVSTLQVKP